MHDGPLDMRMDQEGKLTAADVVNTYKEEDLADLIYKYGEERWSRRIAQFIVEKRKEKPLRTTSDLVSVIKAAIPKKARQDGPHPAKRTFQAIRIEVNDELKILDSTMETAVKHLKKGDALASLPFILWKTASSSKVSNEWPKAASVRRNCPFVCAGTNQN